MLSLAFAAAFLALSVADPSADQVTPQGCVPGPHSGIITADQEWCFVHNPHLVNGGVTVAAGATLTVEPDVEVLFSPGAGLGVFGTLIAEGTVTQPITFTEESTNWAGMTAASGSRLRLAYCDVGYGGNDAWHRAVGVSTPNAQIHSCRIHHSLGIGLLVDGGARTTVWNVALVDNAWAVLSLASGARVDGVYLTLARNGTGAYVATGTTAVLTNTILAENTTGVNVVGGGSARLARTLWDSNATPVVGVVKETGGLFGPAAFDADGYHLTGISMALGRGLNAGVTDDIDGQARPLPGGTHPDLGADESDEPAVFAVYVPLVLRLSP